MKKSTGIWLAVFGMLLTGQATATDPQPGDRKSTEEILVTDILLPEGPQPHSAASLYVTALLDRTEAEVCVRFMADLGSAVVELLDEAGCPVALWRGDALCDDEVVLYPGEKGGYLLRISAEGYLGEGLFDY